MVKTPLVLLHGYPFNHTMWNKVIAMLGTETRVIAPDICGFGETDLRGIEPSLDDAADDVVRQLPVIEINQAAIAGFSMGGYVALTLAERHPQCVAGLAL